MLRKLQSHNPKQYWGFLNSLKPKHKESNSPSIQEFYEHFQSVYASTEESIEDEFPFDDNFMRDTTEFLDLPISETEIEKCIKNMQNGKSPSPTDQITNEYIKTTMHMLMPVYTKLFNCVLETGFLPESWLTGTIIPIFKNKGESNNPTNYRPITILSCLGKLFTSILNNRLNSYLEEFAILSENQAGFRKGYSCTDHIFTLNTLIQISKRSKNKLFCAFIDFSQAFDKVWRVGLWQKLLFNSIKGKFFRVIYNMYDNIKSCVSHQGSVTNLFACENGVRQGENLSPVLFSLFLNDLQATLESDGINGVALMNAENNTWRKLLILLYADDTIILSNSADDLQNALNSFNNYCTDWHLTVNLQKSKIVIFGARNTNIYAFNLNDQQIEIVDSYQYLGVVFSSNGSFLKARKHVVQQATKAMYALFTKSNNADLPIDLTLKLFDHTVVPILVYGAEVYGYENLDIIEKIHKDFLRKITKSRKSTPIYMLYGELGRYPLSIIIHTRMIAYWNKLIQGRTPKLSHQIYKHMLSHNNINDKWISKIKEILNQTGLTYVWQNQNDRVYRHIHKRAKQTMIDQFKQSWNDQVTQSSKGLFYKSFKQNVELGKYITLLPEHEYITLFKLRTANHRFPIETGRWDGTPQQERLCLLCNTDSVGTEIHYILDCPIFTQDRIKFLTSLTNPHLPREVMFDRLINSTNYDTLISLCRFVKILMSKF